MHGSRPASSSFESRVDSLEDLLPFVGVLHSFPAGSAPPPPAAGVVLLSSGRNSFRILQPLGENVQRHRHSPWGQLVSWVLNSPLRAHSRASRFYLKAPPRESWGWGWAQGSKATFPRIRGRSLQGPMGFGIPWQSQGSGVFQEVGVMIAIFANGKTEAHKVKIIWQSCIYI